MWSIQSNLCQQPPLYSDHFFSSWWTKKAIHWLLFKGRYTLGDKLQQHDEATHRSNKSLRVYWRIFVKIFVAATEFCRHNKSHRFSHLFFCDLLQGQNPVVETKIFTKILQTHEVICHDLSLRHVCRLTLLLQLITRPVHMEWSVAATCCYNLSPRVYRLQNLFTIGISL